MKKRVISILLAMMLLTAMLTVTAFAAGTGTITVENPTVGQTYSVYKIFDATYSGDDVATYTIKSSAAGYALVSAEDSPFNLTGPINGTTDTYAVTVKNGQTSDSVLAWIKTQTPPQDALIETKTAVAGEELTFTGLDDGYYYVQSSLGAIVSITNLDNQKVVRDKNQKPGWGAEAGKFVKTDRDTDYTTENDAYIGETLHFRIAVNNAMNYDGENAIAEYKIEDLEGVAIHADFHTMKLKINGQEVGGGWIDGVCDTHNSSHAVAENDTTTNATNYRWKIINASNTDSAFFISIRWHNGERFYSGIHTDGTPNTIELTYDGVLNTEATYANTTLSNTNTAKLSWTYVGGNGNGDMTEYVTKTYTYALSLVKVDATTQAKLAGAEFQLKDADGNVIRLLKAKDQPTGYTRYYVDSETARASEATAYDANAEDADSAIFETVVTDATGTIAIRGLAEGTYTLTEVTPPEGYNGIADIEVEVNTEKSTHSLGGINTVQSVIENAKGTVLPETGSTGTMLFILLGGLAVIGAGIVLVTNKRVSKEGF